MKKICLFILSIFLMIPIFVDAAGNVSVNKTSLNIEEGKTGTFVVTATNAAGRVDISTSNASVATIDKTKEWVENGNVTVTVTGVSSGNAVITVKVSASTFDEEEINKTETINVSVSHELSSNANLSDIKIDNVSLSGFSSNATTYTLPIDKTSISIAAVVEEEHATVSGIGNHNLSYGLNTIPLVVTAEDGTTKKTYTLKITRADNRESNNFLESLTIEEGSLIFDKNKLNYEVEVTQDVTSVNIAAVAESSKATVTGTGKQNLTGNSTTFSIVVKAENETTKTYKITVNKIDNRDSNNYLKSLTVSEGTLKFNKNTTDYVVYVSDTITSINISAEAESDKATLTGTGVKTLGETNNSFQIVVKAENQTTKTYNITVIRSADIVLSYDSNKGSLCSPSYKSVAKGKSWGELCTPIREGYTFDGWFTELSGGILVTASSIADENMTVYAHWTQTIVNPNTGLKTPLVVLICLVVISIGVLIFIRKRDMAF